MTDDLLQRISGAVAIEEAKRQAKRARHPLATEMIDSFRAAGFPNARITYARNDEGVTTGRPQPESGWTDSQKFIDADDWRIRVTTRKGKK